MKFPSLKNALLCRILVYVVVLGGFLAPIPIVAALPFVPDFFGVLFAIGMIVGLLIYIVRNFAVLFTLDTMLATLHCDHTAANRFSLPQNQTIEGIERKLRRYGKRMSALPLFPRPSVLGYHFSSSWTVYAKGIERVVALYPVDCLDKEGYFAILRSAKANSSALKGKKKPFFLDKEQKKASLARVTVAVILARTVETSFFNELFETVCKATGDELEDAMLVCVVDEARRACVFDSRRVPFISVYPAKNRGIRLIRKYVLGGRLHVEDAYRLPSIEGMEDETSLWQVWLMCKKELVQTERENKKRFSGMRHGEVVMEEDYIYVKWQERGVWLAADVDEQAKKVQVDEPISWDYPKANTIAKKDKREIEQLIVGHFMTLGYSCLFERQADEDSTAS